MTAANPPATGSGTDDAKRPGGGFPWAALIFLGPAGLLLLAFLAFPTVYTVFLSFNRGRGGEFSNWVGFDNWVRLFTQDPNFLRLGFPPSGALINNVLWIVFYVSLTVLLGLILAVMATRVRYEALIKGIVFLPQAIAATSLAIIWRFVYSPDPNTGLMNAILGIGNVGPVSLLGNPDTVNWALIAVGIWGSVGFATVILSAAIKGISSEVLEAARVDGAKETQIFWRIIVPMVSLPISVVAGDAHRQRHQALRHHLRHDRRWPRCVEPRDRVLDVPGGVPAGSVRVRRRNRRRHAPAARAGHDLQHPAIPS